MSSEQRRGKGIRPMLDHIRRRQLEVMDDMVDQQMQQPEEGHMQPQLPDPLEGSYVDYLRRLGDDHLGMSYAPRQYPVQTDQNGNIRAWPLYEYSLTPDLHNEIIPPDVMREAVTRWKAEHRDAYYKPMVYTGITKQSSATVVDLPTLYAHIYDQIYTGKATELRQIYRNLIFQYRSGDIDSAVNDMLRANVIGQKVNENNDKWGMAMTYFPVVDLYAA